MSTKDVLAAAALALASAGCMIPSYQLPAGFSSTYQRQIYGMEPVPPDARNLGLAAVETKAGIFYPTPNFRDSSPPTLQARDKDKDLAPMALESQTKPVAPLQPL